MGLNYCSLKIVDFIIKVLRDIFKILDLFIYLLETNYCSS